MDGGGGVRAAVQMIGTYVSYQRLPFACVHEIKEAAEYMEAAVAAEVVELELLVLALASACCAWLPSGA